MKCIKLFFALIIASIFPSIAIADGEITVKELGRKLDAIAKENKSLRQRIKKLEAAENSTWSATSKKAPKKNYRSSSKKTGVVETTHRYSYEILNPLWDITSKPKLILEKKKDGLLKQNSA